MNTRAWSSAIALASLVSVLGCGGEESMTPGVGAGGAGGAAGGGTAGGAAGSSSGGMACGPKVCMTPMIPPGLPVMARPACCVDAATGTCGSLNGTMCMPPLPVPPACPPPPSFMGVMTTACCTPNNICGVDASMLGLGCFNIGSIPGIGGGGPATMCDGTPVMMPPPRAGSGAGGVSGGSAAGASGAAAGASGAAAGASGAAAGASGA
ncbi:MAG TPA: hypothetical protein VJV78_35550, partial [Polyangiales bacterium]|nr:hypothetical protein [Polyangiales bacterium]